MANPHGLRVRVERVRVRVEFSRPVKNPYPEPGHHGFLGMIVQGCIDTPRGRSYFTQPGPFTLPYYYNSKLPPLPLRSPLQAPVTPRSLVAPWSPLGPPDASSHVDMGSGHRQARLPPLHPPHASRRRARHRSVEVCNLVYALIVVDIT